MIAVGDKEKILKTKTDGIIVIICICYHCWWRIIVYPYFIRLNVLFGLKKKKGINEFAIGYMINPGLNVNKSFRYQVEKCMYTKFGEITQYFIKSTLSKNNTSVLTLIMFYETRSDNTKKVFRVLSCVIYNKIKNYVCIDYLACQ